MSAGVRYSPNFILSFDVEKNFPIEKAHLWMIEHYHHCLYYTGVYLATVYFLQKYMRNRKAFELRTFLTVWNALLAAISFCAALRFIQELVHVVAHFGFRFSVCNPSYLTHTPTTAFWTYVCCATKVLELADTVFVVLRKQRLTFLHWFHHCSVLVFTWVGIRDITAAARWPMAVNFSVHAIMYSYYAFRAAGFQISRFVALLITTVQILQMVVGFYICFQGSVWGYTGVECAGSPRIALFGVSIFLIYFGLFARFFVSSYMKPKIQ